MTTRDAIGIERVSIQSRLVTVFLFLLAQVVAALLIGSVALAVSPAQAAEAQRATLITPGDARAGSLFLKNRGNSYADAARLGIDVDITVSGPTLRARVTGLFRNPTLDWMEATYVYPLPEGRAVDTLKMVVGDRVIVGETVS
jgi:Ca-activated chloride channel homolog